MADTTDASAAADIVEPVEVEKPAFSAASVMSHEEMAAEVKRCKGVLDSKDSPEEELLVALVALRQMGPLPTKVLSETLIGKAVNNIAKGGPSAAATKKAKELVEEWRQEHRKRKAATEGGNPELKRGKSSTLSLGSEAPSKEVLSSQEAPSKELKRTNSAPSKELQRTDSDQANTLTRSDSLLSVNSLDDTQASQEDEVAPYRSKVRQKLLETLGKAEEIEAKDGSQGGTEEMRDPVKLADEIDLALHGTFPKKDEYMAQARSILFNLKDKKNQSFKFKLMVGFYKPTDVPKLGAEDMASDEKNEERAKQRKYAMLEIQSDWALKNGDMRFTGMFTCGRCKGTKTTYFQMQTRSSDEPMTTFVSCITCNNRWKFC